MTYEPPQKYIDNYADILVNLGCNEGEGLRAGQRVFIDLPHTQERFIHSLTKYILQAGGHPVTRLKDGFLAKTYLEYASDEQLAFVSGVDRFIIDNTDLRITMEIKSFESFDTEKISLYNMRVTDRFKRMLEKESEGVYTWTIGSLPTQELANHTGESLESIWKRLAYACYLDEEEPLQEWRNAQTEINRVKKSLDNLNIKSLHVQSKGTNLTIGLGEQRKWLGLSGRNIPSYEVFTSPDWRLVQGYMTFSQPLQYNNNTIENIFLQFDKGVVVDAKASKGQQDLDKLISAKGGNKVGEFSMTDKRLSRIYKPLGLDIPDENIGGEFGNTHLALGHSYKDSYVGNRFNLSTLDLKRLGYNDDAEVHEDIISLDDRIITATLQDNSKKLIYKDGMFTI